MVILAFFTVETLVEDITVLNKVFNETMYIVNSFLIYSRLIILILGMALCLALSFKNSKCLSFHPNTVNLIYLYCIPFLVLNNMAYRILNSSEVDILNHVFIISTLNWDCVPPPLYFSYCLSFIDVISAVYSIQHSASFDSRTN